MAFWKESMINRLSNLINRNRSAAKISQVLCSSNFTPDTSAVNPYNRGFTCFVVKTNSRDLRVFGVKF